MLLVDFFLPALKHDVRFFIEHGLKFLIHMTSPLKIDFF